MRFVNARRDFAHFSRILGFAAVTHAPIKVKLIYFVYLISTYDYMNYNL